MEKFEKRFEAENIIEVDEQYQRWLDIYHPNHTSSKKSVEATSSSTAETVLIPVPTSSIACEKILSNQSLSKHIPAIKAKSFGRVLTSAENLKIMEEKEQKKQKESYGNESQSIRLMNNHIHTYICSYSIYNTLYKHS